MHSSLKLKAFGYALSPLSRIRKKSLIPFQKKKKREKFFFLKNEGLSSIKVSKLDTFDHASFK